MPIANAVRPIDNVGQRALTTSPREVGETYQNFRRQFDAEPVRRWEIEVQEKICALASRTQGWDGQHALPVKWDAGMFALNLLSKVMQSRTPPPTVVPSPIGGVQLEWHERDIDLELHVTAPYSSELWFEDHRTGNSYARDLADDVEDLRSAIRLLTAR